MCGGTAHSPRRSNPAFGLSPRVRGNHSTPRRPRSYLGSIPACAGEPLPPCRRPCSTTVYPRVCGGTTYGTVVVFDMYGLSPRVRGNHRIANESNVARRSIPACAGEPAPASATPEVDQVYPRVCGGTRDFALDIDDGDGLSPRVRGNLPRALPVVVPDGSIPACAGEPRPRGSSGR